MLANVKDCIDANVDNPLLRLGLEDLGLRKGRALHTKNILVTADTEEIGTAQLCIIDQPSQRIYGRLDVSSLRVVASVHITLPRRLQS